MISWSVARPSSALDNVDAAARGRSGTRSACRRARADQVTLLGRRHDTAVGAGLREHLGMWWFACRSAPVAPLPDRARGRRRPLRAGGLTARGVVGWCRGADGRQLPRHRPPAVPAPRVVRRPAATRQCPGCRWSGPPTASPWSRTATGRRRLHGDGTGRAGDDDLVHRAVQRDDAPGVPRRRRRDHRRRSSCSRSTRHAPGCSR